MQQKHVLQKGRAKNALFNMATNLEYRGGRVHVKNKVDNHEDNWANRWDELAILKVLL